MKKIGLVTLVGYFNYGNRLQNYALKTSIEKFGFEIESLTFYRKPFLTNFVKNNQESISFHPILFILRIVKKVSNLLFYSKSEKIRNQYFFQFTKDLLNEKKYDATHENDYDFFIVGSDQVWNPNFIRNQPEFFLPFTDKEKKVAYAASFGVSSLDSDVESVYTPYLNDFSLISVREDDGAKLIKEMTGREVPVLLDPTMLLTKEEWNRIAQPAANRLDGKKYLLTYFLAGLDAEKRKIVSDVSQRYGYKVIAMGDKNDVETYRTSPRAFIDYIKHCDFFLTDSFHGVVFSILYHKPFVIFPRGNMNSRINTLLETFHLSDRKVSRIRKWDDSVFEMDFQIADQVLTIERERSINFLKKALKVEE